jgi:hypothetical protein
LKHLKTTLLLLGAAALLLPPTVGQAKTDQDKSLWLMAAAQGSLAPPGSPYSQWRWWFDGQARFSDASSGYGQSIVRPGVGYAITDRSTLWIGYGWIRTSPAHESDVEENRIWQQWTGSTTLANTSLSWRSRLEQRFVEGGSDVGWRYRQFFKVVHPIAFGSRLQLVGYDELFFALNKTDWGAKSGFDQNRIFAGLGWQFDSTTTFEVGYLNQFVQREGAPNLANHILSLNALLQF